MVLKQMLKKYDVNLWTKLNWLRVGSRVAGSYAHGKFFNQLSDYQLLE
jgi:hypothetical protein